MTEREKFERKKALKELKRMRNNEDPFNKGYIHKTDFNQFEINAGDYVTIRHTLAGGGHYPGGARWGSGRYLGIRDVEASDEMEKYAGMTLKVVEFRDGLFVLDGVPEEIGLWSYGMFSDHWERDDLGMSHISEEDLEEIVRTSMENTPGMSPMRLKKRKKRGRLNTTVGTIGSGTCLLKRKKGRRLSITKH